MGTVVLDSSIVIALLDPTDAHRGVAFEAVSAETLNDSRFIIPASVIAESMVGIARAGGRDLVRRRLGELEEVFGPPRPVDTQVAVQTSLLRAGHRSLRLPDALVIATGIVEEADLILTTDKRWRGVDDRVRILD